MKNKSYCLFFFFKISTFYFILSLKIYAKQKLKSGRSSAEKYLAL